MNFNNLLNPGTTLGAFIISVAASLIVGIFLGFCSGRKYEKMITNNIIQIGTHHSAEQNGTRH